MPPTQNATFTDNRQVMSLLLAECELGDVDVSDLPGNSAIVGSHIAGDTLTLAHSLDVVGVCSIKSDDCVDPFVSGHSAAVILCALDGAAPAHSVAILGAERGELLVVDRDVLGVVACSVVELVFNNIRGDVPLDLSLLTVHSDLLSCDSICAISLDGHLGVGAGAQKSVRKDRPGG